MRNLILWMALIALTLGGCDQQMCTGPDPSADALRIIPLGDSRVEGASDSFDSYRYKLWKKLIENGWEVDFIGSRFDDFAYAQVSGRCFDGNHEGTGGATTSSLLATLESLTLESEPEVALLGIGGNDLLDLGAPVPEVLANLGEIVKNLRGRNEDITIFLEQIAPGITAIMTPDLTASFLDYNRKLITFADSLTTNSSKIILVDMAEGWSDGLLADEVHYNEAGAQLVADRYFAAIDLAIQK